MQQQIFHVGLRPLVLRRYNVDKKEGFKRPRTDGLKYKHENGTNIFGERVNNFLNRLPNSFFFVACYEQMEPRDSMRKSTQAVSNPHDVMQAEHKVFEPVETVRDKDN